ncbi:MULTISPECIES: 23S rRNA (uracil(1939)-C(5))-methyltransferase RlmD [Acidithiobacillus]|uniref:23S rRNA (uracil(1939)-C(5))-methyltransferase RlmD n=2 Tax=Acidithiobacillus caldus TaxID=33059 RepID=A0A059ZRJ2_ACICK|nr:MULTISPECIES: 23S rRNA (uracil(1939)-C(5))-methyltransferase RlmD [Acidithiobacillus]AIA54163.1 RNA methyltransferase, TrmA family [Acidithiobacillus caldus ATCC 51756]MBU2730493.1 23S rRNA (uracil(1939)-C(5))-methyltransferase RlmD [Acidithiobacillus caldus]MBU2736867.1 23S rRNA (uracil(1939)-C(5))-methyltransferase RlmD [Acidithiobacillus caldus ATCC 51756]MBU2744042.1 23S rRNA (uracil(1939)-C(5))-methyltransferase RlmD [Acidithiobacillus caldus]MBU2763623.1 23S rRNA (uracil(1939)-C(5))-m
MTRPKPLRDMPVERVHITGLDGEGTGVARVDGKVLFVAGALPGECVRVRRYEGTPRYDRARVVEVERASSQRVTPPCAHAGVCGGCSLQHLEPGAQIAVKQRHLEDQLQHIGRVRPARILPPIQGPSLHYRSKARLSVRVPKTRGALVGFREYHSSFVAAMESCPVLDPRVGERILDLRALVARLQRPAAIPQWEIACTDAHAVLILRHLDALSRSDLRLLQGFADAHGLRILLQGGGPESLQALPGEDVPELEYALPEFDLRLRFQPLGFIQVNPWINPVLVRRAMALLAPEPGEEIVDLFCGLGNFTLPMARLGARALGVEGDTRLVAQARFNAELNGLAARAHFIAADLTQTALADLPGAAGVRKMLIDPPRSGAIEILKGIGPALRRLVYVSCNPDTLARDSAYLVQQQGFRLEAAGIVNMFPHTAHVESVALFTR